MKFETKSIHSGQQSDPLTGAVMTPIYQTSTYQQDAVGQHRGFEYSRTGNPTRSVLENCLADLEGSEFGLAFSSGMAAIDTLIRILEPGDHVLVGNDVYGGTYRLFESEYRRFNIDFSYVNTAEIDQVVSSLKPNTRQVWLETPTNPLLNISDIEVLAEVVHDHAPGISVVVDNTFATPYLQQPLAMGADVVVHSTTKYLGGHSDIVGGAIVSKNRAIHERLSFLQNAAGAIPGPMDCFLVLRGIKTLPVRMDRHAENAAKVTDFLHTHPRVTKVFYPFHSSHPQSKLAHRQMRNGGGMVSFVLMGGEEGAKQVTESTKIFKLAESLGGVESLIEVPSIMTHASTANSPLAVDPGLVRLSVGLEHIDDLIADLEQSLATE
ncbi:MAG: cystathionine gamma-synthase [Anaerolineales bacterium]